jgi:hypothetical protein
MSDRITHAFGYPYINSIPDFIADHNGDTDCYAIAYTDPIPTPSPTSPPSPTPPPSPAPTPTPTPKPSSTPTPTPTATATATATATPRHTSRPHPSHGPATGCSTHSNGNTSTRRAFKLGIKVVVQTNGYLYFVR